MSSALLQKPFVLLRHGETDWNVEKRCLGQVDRRLTDRGRSQARDAIPFIKQLDVCSVHHSPLVRAAETAEIIAGALDLPLRSVDGLKEASLGKKEGCSEIDPSDEFITDWFSGGLITGAEPYVQFRGRVVEALNDCLASDASLPLIVAHYAVCSAISDAAGLGSMAADHCVPYIFWPSALSWRVERISCEATSYARGMFNEPEYSFTHAQSGREVR